MMYHSVDDLNSVADATAVAESRASYGKPGKGYRDLRVYQESLKFVTSCYQVTQKFPKQEQFGLTSQWRRAAVSVLVNIAEGWGRDGEVEFARYIDISIGSLCEVESLIEISALLRLVTAEERHELAEKSRIVGSMLHKLRIHLRR